MTSVPLEDGGRVRPLRIVSFGEVLFDIFDNGARLGGAPLNLAVHLHRLGAEALLVSAVGRDALGDLAIRKIADEGLSVEHVARVPQPTGSVTVSLNEAKIPTYRFLLDCAYDYIPEPQLDLTQLDLFCFGTLAQRSQASRDALKKLLAKARCQVFCDVNLRQDFYSKDILERSLSAANIAKLNDDELPVIAAMFGLEPESGAVARRFGLDTVILTLGPDGCEIWHRGDAIASPACPVQVVSTVGAGDAFSAGFLFHYLSGHRIEIAAAAGNRLAAEVASIPGAF